MKATSTLGLLAALLTGCSGGGSGSGPLSSCQSIGPNTTFTSAEGTVENLDAAADQDMSTFATMNAKGSGGWVTSKGNNFLAGSNAGVFLNPPGNWNPAGIEVSTFADVEESTLESATGAELTITSTGGDPATHYVSFTTSAPYNGVRFTVYSMDSADYLVYEICGAATVR